MGYSEVYCHICGVSFNIGRIRTENEPRSAAWVDSKSFNLISPCYVDSGYASPGECGRKSGCKLVFREDMLEEQQRMRDRSLSVENVPDIGEFLSQPEEGCGQTKENDEEKRLKLLYEEDGNDLDFVPDPAVVRPVDIDEAMHSGWAVSDQKNDEEVGSIAESMDYEYDTPADTCSELSDEGSEGTDDDEDHSSEAYYRTFVNSLSEGPVPPPPQRELILPLFRPLEGRDEDAASVHGSDASFECDEAPGTYEYARARTEHRVNGKLSIYKHPLNLDKYRFNSLWEHIAGPGCVGNRGYNGHNISVQEIALCNTLQCLVQKKHAGKGGWKPLPDDEDFERESSWFLSGLSDHMPSRDCSWPCVYPPRQNLDLVPAENSRWEPDINRPDPNYAMPFHPTCLEVYKRACLKRRRRIDIDSLASWWMLKANYTDFHNFPRHQAVKRGESQWWQHNQGDEFLAANPCFIPGLEDILSQSLGTQMHGREISADTPFSLLSFEILGQIWSYCDAADLSNCAIAIPDLQPSVRAVLPKVLEEQHPYLWEVWCQLPYSKWTGKSATELKACQKEFDQQEQEIACVFGTLREEDRGDVLEACTHFWNTDREERKMAIFGPSLAEIPALQLRQEGLNVFHFYSAFDKALKESRLKGMENRARIWADCETIMDQVDELKREGQMLDNGQPSPGAKIFGR